MVDPSQRRHRHRSIPDHKPYSRRPELAMPPGRRGDGCTEQDHRPETSRHGCNEDAPSHLPPPPFPGIVPVAASKQQQKKKQKQEQHRVASLPEDILIEIISQVPYRLLCRFKCVSKAWLALCSDVDIHNRSPRAASGFFFIGKLRHGFSFHDLTVAGRPPLVDPTLAFLGCYERISVEQCCTGGILLCKCWVSRSGKDKYSYVVCNPATEKWTVLPHIENSDRVDGHRFVSDPTLLDDHLSKLNESEHLLGFDTANPSSFVVVVPQTVYFGQVGEVVIYSSKTGRWTVMPSRWSPKTILIGGGDGNVFINDTMYFTTLYTIVTVDTEGQIWREIEVPDGHRFGSIGHSQGYLHYWDVDCDCQLNVWVLEDYGTGNWTLKHTVNILEPFGRHHRIYGEYYEMVAIHPHCNFIFLTSGEMSVAYDMDNREVHVICTSEDLLDGVPYIPCFAKWPEDG